MYILKPPLPLDFLCEFTGEKSVVFLSFLRWAFIALNNKAKPSWEPTEQEQLAWTWRQWKRAHSIFAVCLSVWKEANGTKMPSGVEITIVPLYFVYEVAICKWTTLKKYQLSIKLEECKSFYRIKEKVCTTARIKPPPPNRPLIILFDRFTKCVAFYFADFAHMTGKYFFHWRSLFHRHDFPKISRGYKSFKHTAYSVLLHCAII